MRYLERTGLVKPIADISEVFEAIYNDEDLLIRIAERYMDPDSSYSFAKFNQLFRIPKLNLLKTEAALNTTGDFGKSVSFSSHYNPNLLDIIGLESLDMVLDDIKIDRIAVISQRREEEKELNQLRGSKDPQGLSIKDLVNKRPILPRGEYQIQLLG